MLGVGHYHTMSFTLLLTCFADVFYSPILGLLADGEKIAFCPFIHEQKAGE